MSKEARKCPNCGKIYTARPALCRNDNKTEICPECGQQEALDSIPKETITFDFKEGTYTKEECKSLDLIKDCTGMILVLNPKYLGEKYKKSKYQLWKAEGGFGTRNYTSGRAIFSKGLADGETARWDRNCFMGALTDNMVKKLYGLQSQEDMENSEELCEHCGCTDYGDNMNAKHISVHSSGCEGSYCSEAYDYYVDNLIPTEELVSNYKEDTDVKEVEDTLQK